MQMKKIEFDPAFVEAMEKENARRMPLLKELKPDHWFHVYDTAKHCEIVLNEAVRMDGLHLANGLYDFDAELLRLAAMAHDWGKLETWNPDGSPWFAGHERVSAEILEGMDAPDPLVRIVKYHGRCMEIDKFGDKAVRKLVRSISPKSIDRHIPVSSEPDGALWLALKNKEVEVEGDLIAYYLLLICDCAGFSPEGRWAGFTQATQFAKLIGLPPLSFRMARGAPQASG